MTAQILLLSDLSFSRLQLVGLKTIKCPLNHNILKVRIYTPAIIRQLFLHYK